MKWSALVSTLHEASQSRYCGGGERYVPAVVEAPWGAEDLGSCSTWYIYPIANYAWLLYNLQYYVLRDARCDQREHSVCSSISWSQVGTHFRVQPSVTVVVIANEVQSRCTGLSIKMDSPSPKLASIRGKFAFKDFAVLLIYSLLQARRESSEQYPTPR